jgi:hypothetical protein
MPDETDVLVSSATSSQKIWEREADWSRVGERATILGQGVYGQVVGADWSFVGERAATIEQGGYGQYVGAEWSRVGEEISISIIPPVFLTGARVTVI